MALASTTRPGAAGAGPDPGRAAVAGRPSPTRRARPTDSAGLVVALVERALADGGLLFTKASPGFQCFYRLALQPALFGGVDLVREWGLVAPVPNLTRRLVAHFDTPDEVLAPLGHAVGVRLRHGYRARALPGRFVPSAPEVLWCPTARPGGDEPA